MAVVWERDDATMDGTHALVIGVGDYPWCKDGSSGQVGPGCHLIRQLDSPIWSAHALATWLVEHADDFDRPLQRITLLTEPLDEYPWATPPTEPTFSKVRTAMRAWQASGDEEATMLLYACGHGLEHDGRQLLLCKDVGEEGDVWERVLDVRGTFTRARLNPPKTQLWLLDACRDAAEALRLYDPDGRIALPDGTQSGLAAGVYRDLTMVVGSGLFSQAAGLPGETSLFWQALQQALEWRAWRKIHGKWVLRTTDLVSPINDALEDALGEDSGQRCTAFDGIGQHPVLSSDKPPIVPSTFVCDPAEAQERVLLGLDQLTGEPWREQDEPGRWRVRVPAGTMWLRGREVGGDGTSQREVVTLDPDNPEGVLPWSP